MLLLEILQHIWSRTPRTAFQYDCFPKSAFSAGIAFNWFMLYLKICGFIIGFYQNRGEILPGWLPPSRICAARFFPCSACPQNQTVTCNSLTGI